MRNILRLTLVPSCVLLSFVTYSQRTISGTITDGNSGEPLFGAMIYDTLSKQGAGANEYGFFSLTIPDGPAVLRVSYYGFERQFINVPASQSELNLELSSAVKEIQIPNARAYTVHVLLRNEIPWPVN
jgi:hypothetical protein